jgi:hypothetical protein
MTRRWHVVDADDGIVRAETTARATLRWAMTMNDANRVYAQTRLGDGLHEYMLVGAEYDPDEIGAVSASVWICRGDVLAHHGFDPDQAPHYPYADRPYELVERESPGGAT